MMAIRCSCSRNGAVRRNTLGGTNDPASSVVAPIAILCLAWCLVQFESCHHHHVHAFSLRSIANRISLRSAIPATDSPPLLGAPPSPVATSRAPWGLGVTTDNNGQSDPGDSVDARSAKKPFFADGDTSANTNENTEANDSGANLEKLELGSHPRPPLTPKRPETHPPDSLWKRAKNEDLDLGKLAVELTASQERLDRASNAVLGAIAFAKNLPARVEESIETSRKILETVEETIEQTQQLPGRITRSVRETRDNVNKSVRETKESVEETIERTQRAVQTVREIPGRVTKSVKETKESVEETIDRTQKTVKTVQEFPGKVKQSVEDTQHDVKVFLGLERPNLKKRLEPPTVPMTLEEEAIDLAGKATAATVKAAIWTGKEVSSLAWKGAKKAYNTTIGPAVEDAWNEQVQSISSSIDSTTKAMRHVPPTRSAKKRKPIAVSEPIAKSPSELKKELDDAESLFQEVADALDAAERAMKLNPNSELEDPMITIGGVADEPEGEPPTTKPLSKKESKKASKKAPFGFWKRPTREQRDASAASEMLMARIRNAKTPEQLDANRKEEEELANEIADALAMAEQALTVTSSTTNQTSSNSETKGDESSTPESKATS